MFSCFEDGHLLVEVLGFAEDGDLPLCIGDLPLCILYLRIERVILSPSLVLWTNCRHQGNNCQQPLVGGKPVQMSGGSVVGCVMRTLAFISGS